VSDIHTNITSLTECYSGKYLKKLAGRTDIEDALKRLDKLTHEEARMAIAENLKATHAVGDRVRGVMDGVVDVGDAVRDVGARVANVGDGVTAVNDRVTVVIDGAHTFSSFSPKFDEA
jgi:hypothetical protein